MSKAWIMVGVLAVMAASATAQNNWYAGAHLTAQRATLLNKSDRQSGAVTNKPQLTPGGGLKFGFTNNHLTGFRGFSFGFQYNQYRTKGISQLNEAQGWGLAHTRLWDTKLTYFSIPLETQWGIGQFGRFEPFVKLGLYGAFLTKYREEQKSEPPRLSPTIVFEGKVLMEDRSGYTLKRGVYKGWDIGGSLAIGTTYAITERFHLSVQAGATCSFMDIERKKNLEYARLPPSYPSISPNFWEHNTPKGVVGRYDEGMRTATRLLVPSVQIGCNYYLNHLRGCLNLI